MSVGPPVIAVSGNHPLFDGVAALVLWLLFCYLLCHSPMLPNVAYYAIFPYPLFCIMLSANSTILQYYNNNIFCCAEHE